jgi:hypothetical protein
MDTSSLFRINIKDVARGLIVAVASAVFLFLGTALTAADFNFATFDWNLLIKVASSAALAYLSKNFFSDNSGKLMGKI